MVFACLALLAAAIPFAIRVPDTRPFALGCGAVYLLGTVGAVLFGGRLSLWRI